MRRLQRNTKKEVKVNTTALPDIIFMLLFYFMMTTVMQNQNLNSLQLPGAYNISTKENADDSDLEVYLGQSSKGAYVQVNNIKGSMGNYATLMAQEANRIRQKGVFVSKAYLYIDSESPMSIVNNIKTELQLLNISKVHYVHNRQAIN